MKKINGNNRIVLIAAAVFLVCAIVFVFIYWPIAPVFLVMSLVMLLLGRKLALYIVRQAYDKVKCAMGKDKQRTPAEDSREDTDEQSVASQREYAGIDSEIKAQFDNLDMITISAIAIMLSDAKAKAASPYIKQLEKTDIKHLLLTFLKDTYYITDIRQLNRLFCSAYYRRKIKKYLNKVVVFVRRGISYSLPKKNIWIISRMRTASKQTKVYIERICDTLNTFESVKFVPALSGNEEISSSKRNFKLDHLNDCYKDALIYLVDILLTCTCISKMLFTERMIHKMPADSEFTKIIVNLAGSLNNHNLVISKSRPIYQQYYQDELGYISGEDVLYGMAVTIMVNKIKKTEIKNKELLALDFIPENARELGENMQKWLDGLAEKNSASDIGALILQRISILIKGNYSLLLTAFGELLNWESYYNQRVDYYARERDKERYLKGDLGKEIMELSEYYR